jgi:hypothetical protein
VPCGEEEVVIVVRDISERARLEAERQQAETALSQQQSQKPGFNCRLARFHYAALARRYLY